MQHVSIEMSCVFGKDCIVSCRMCSMSGCWQSHRIWCRVAMLSQWVHHRKHICVGGFLGAFCTGSLVRSGVVDGANSLIFHTPALKL